MKMSDVFLNGRFVGTVPDHIKFIEDIKSERRKGTMSRNVNVHHNKESDEVRIESLGGRLRRPLIVVRNGVSLLTPKHVEQLNKGELTWGALVQQGVIESPYAPDEEDALISFFDDEITPETTNQSLHPMDMFGLTTALVPYSKRPATSPAQSA